MSEGLGRLKIEAIDELVEQYMEFLPRGVIDLSDEASRDQMRQWMCRVSRAVLSTAVFGFQKASAKAINDVATLMRDPAHAEKRRERRRRERAAIKAQLDAQDHQHVGRKVLRKLLDDPKVGEKESI